EGAEQRVVERPGERALVRVEDRPRLSAVGSAVADRRGLAVAGGVGAGDGERETGLVREVRTAARVVRDVPAVRRLRRATGTGDAAHAARGRNVDDGIAREEAVRQRARDRVRRATRTARATVSARAARATASGLTRAAFAAFGC